MPRPLTSKEVLEIEVRITDIVVGVQRAIDGEMPAAELGYIFKHTKQIGLIMQEVCPDHLHRDDTDSARREPMFT
jgi:hypothetical protein